MKPSLPQNDTERGRAKDIAKRAEDYGWNYDYIPHIPMLQLLKTPIIFDGRNLYEPETIGHFGLEYYAIGRGQT